MAQHSVDLPPPYKREPGMTKVFATPLRLRISGVAVDPELEARVPDLLGRKLERYAKDVTRVALRFADAAGARGAIDVVCRIEISVKDRDDLVVEGRAREAADAFTKASTLARAALEKALEKRAPAKKRAATRKPARRTRR